VPHLHGDRRRGRAFEIQDQTYVYFHTQPADEAQVKIAEDSLAICPTGAIGNDGE
jgi:ferredoxin